MLREVPHLPPVELAPRVRLVRLPLRGDVVDAIRLRLMRARQAVGPDALAHELGDVRFAATFGPRRRAPDKNERWHGALAVFGLVEGPRPALLAYTLRPVGELAAVAPPQGWSDDPVDWAAAKETPLLPRIERRTGLDVPFAAEIWPKARIVDPAKMPSGKRRIPRMREIDAAKLEQQWQPGLSRAEAYGVWLQRQLPTAVIAPVSVRIMGETTVAKGDGRSFGVLGLRLNGLLRLADAATMTVALLRGVGRRRAYGLGLLVVA